MITTFVETTAGGTLGVSPVHMLATATEIALLLRGGLLSLLLDRSTILYLSLDGRLKKGGTIDDRGRQAKTCSYSLQGRTANDGPEKTQRKNYEHEKPEELGEDSTKKNLPQQMVQIGDYREKGRQLLFRIVPAFLKLPHHVN